jgi:hypothetical protein
MFQPGIFPNQLTPMKTFALILFVCCLPGFWLNSIGQKQKKPTEIRVSMKPSAWEYDSTTTEFVMYKNTPVVRGKKGGYQIFLKNQTFASGTIEFDVELSGMGFPGINFRMSPDRKNGENFYIRSFGPVKPETRTTLQYAAIIDGVSMWDLADEYQSGAVIHQDRWNHVKLVVSGKQMNVYINDMSKPALRVPELESRTENGGISLSGNVIYANLVIQPNATEGLAPETGYNSTLNETRYLRKWLVSPPKDFPFGTDLLLPLPSMYGTLTKSDMPDSTAPWKPILAESRAIVNLSRLYGGAKDKDGRRLAWLKTTIESDKAQEKTLSLGFSDEAWVFLNGQLVYMDKNYFGTPGQKMPASRCTIENAKIKLALREGKNEILIGLANYFYGWGIIARLDDVDGISLMKE